jgi:hypothetical protein
MPGSIRHGRWREGDWLGTVIADEVGPSKPSFSDVQLHIVDAPFGAGPESIRPVVVMDSGLALRAPRNDGGYGFTVSRRHPPEVCLNFRALKNRGRGATLK